MVRKNGSRIDNLLSRLQPTYNRWIRPCLPQTTRIYNEVVVKDKALLDRTSVYPDFEFESVRQLTDAISPGDRVVIVGGGRGVTAVHAAQANAFHVRIYEAGYKQVQLCRDTAKRNGVDYQISVEHAVIGDDVNVWGKTSGARRISPSDLPPCDVLELDCEGAEVEICRNLGPRPESIIIECHPQYGASKSKVRESLPDEYIVTRSVIDEYDDLPTITAELD